MNVITVERGWHRATDSFAMTYKQAEMVKRLASESEELLIGWDFTSISNAIRQITKLDASRIIDALEKGYKVIIM